MENIYEVFKKNLFNEMALKRDITIMERPREMITPLFLLSSENEKLYSRLKQMFQILSIDHIVKLVATLCEKHQIRCIIPPDFRDLLLYCNGNNSCVKFYHNLDIPSIKARALVNRIREQYDYPISFVILAKNNAHAINTRQFNSQVVNIVYFEDFILNIFGKEELDAFRKSMLTFKDEQRKIIGYQLTEMFNETNKKKLIAKSTKHFYSFDYEKKRKETLRNINKVKSSKGVDLIEDLFNEPFNNIIDTFINEKRYMLLFGDSDYSNSFITSEWLYQQYVSNDELDNTFIVSGYLKSIEQLLWDISVIKGQGRIMTINDKKVLIEDKNDIKATLGALQYFITDYDNIDFFDSQNRYLLKYLRAQIDLWRDKDRNDHFHKDNIKNKEEVETIRDDTYFLLCLILGSINLDEDTKLGLS